MGKRSNVIILLDAIVSTLSQLATVSVTFLRHEKAQNGGHIYIDSTLTLIWGVHKNVSQRD